MRSSLKRRHVTAAGVIAAVSAMGHQAMAADWVHLGGNTEGNQLYYDSNSIRNYELEGRDLTEVGVKLEYGESSNYREKGISNLKYTVEIDCKSVSYRVELYRYTYDDGSVGDVHRGKESFSEIETGSMYSALFQKFCR